MFSAQAENARPTGRAGRYDEKAVYSAAPNTQVAKRLCFSLGKANLVAADGKDGFIELCWQAVKFIAL